MIVLLDWICEHPITAVAVGLWILVVMLIAFSGIVDIVLAFRKPRT